MIDFEIPEEKVLDKVSFEFVHQEFRGLVEIINKAYRKQGLNIAIDSDSFKMELTDADYAEVSNFFFYPTHTIYLYDGRTERQIGYRICFIRRTKKDNLETVSLNFPNDVLKKGEWLNGRETLKKFNLDENRIHVNKLLEITIRRPTYKRRVFTESVGWVKGNSEFHYVPITDFSKDEIRCQQAIKRTFEFAPMLNMDDREAFRKVWELLGVTEKEITVPLLSFTILSSLLSLIKLKNKDQPRFILCLNGDNGKNKESLSNLFCNIYNRSTNIYVLDSRLHANYSMKSEIPNKAGKLKDAVFIAKIEKQNDVKPYLKLMNQDKLINGVLLISNKTVLHDSVITIDISKASFEKSIFQFHKANPSVFSTWFGSFLQHIQTSFQDEHWGLGIKGNIDKFYKTCNKTITEQQAEFDTNRLRHYAWLLLGYLYFLKFGYQTEALSDKEYTDSINEAVDIFRRLSILDLGKESENGEPCLSQLERDSLTFVHTIDKLLNDETLNAIDNKATQPEFGWIGPNELYLMNEKLFKAVNERLRESNEELISRSAEIYRFLFEKGVIPKKGKGSWGIQINSKTKAIMYSIPHMKALLIENGYELAYLGTK
ncbi:hypothetical protein [Paenibacillus sp. GCM10027626]|uniref:hypothetical protein n=1 Tax=Paenibacillus sp. GCM10027626 TaxID=3273411 RepID=UPI0036432F2D